MENQNIITSVIQLGQLDGSITYYRNYYHEMSLLCEEGKATSESEKYKDKLKSKKVFFLLKNII